MSSDDKNKIEALKTVIGFGRLRGHSCASCVWSTEPNADMEDIVCAIGLETFGIEFPVSRTDFCEMHVEDS